MKLIFVTALLVSSASFAADAVPVLIGSFSQVVSVSLAPDATINGTRVHAIVKYKGGCSAPVSFSAVAMDEVSFAVVENREQPKPLTAQCNAVQVLTQDIVVGVIHGPQPNASDIKVNGVSAK
jgi:hypothetical protein